MIHNKIPNLIFTKIKPQRNSDRKLTIFTHLLAQLPWSSHYQIGPVVFTPHDRWCFERDWFLRKNSL